jgi:dolichol-phosphate mannosyltransferase
MPEQQHPDPGAVQFSLVAPVYNEAEVLPDFYRRLQAAAEKLGGPYEIVFVNDGSTDETPQILRRLHEEDDRVKFVELSRNFGHQEALTAGYDFATGQAVVTLDADGQHPPELIGELAGKWRQGYEVVCTVKKSDPNVSFLRRLAVRTVYRLIAALSGLDVADQADFRLLDRKVVEAIRQTREKARFLRGLVRWVGFRQAPPVEYEPEPRQAGSPRYTLRKLARMGSAGMFGFSVLPLRLIGVLGATLMAAAVLYAVCALILWPIVGASLAANLVVLVVGLVGLQLGTMGLLGEYVGRIYEEAKDRPIYVIRETVGFEVPQAAPPPGRAPAERPGPTVEPGRIRLFT